MFRQFIAVVGLFALTAGCAQATRHSNTMIFGTTTQFGIRAGPNAASVPEINVGYARQEAVVMPLVANGEDNGTVQKPCNPAQPVEVRGGDGFPVHPCLLVGVNDKAQDSYSVLASFGSRYGGGVDGTGARTEGAIAQYFATGVAAQLLALEGGASVVATGSAAKQSAENNENKADDIAALYGGDASFTRNVAVRKDYDAFEDRLAAKIQLTKSADLPARLKAFEEATGTASIGIQEDCIGVSECVKALRSNHPYGARYADGKDAFEQALAAWKTDS